MTTHSKKNSKAYSLVAAAAALAVGLIMPLQATAQDQQQQPQQQQLKLVEKAKHGDWAIRCRESDKNANQDTSGKGDLDSAEKKDDANASETPQVCVMIQVARHPEQKNFGLSVLIVKRTIQGKALTELRITTPLGVLLPAGIGVEIDGAAIGVLNFQVCTPPGVCTASTVMEDDLLNKFKSGAAAKLYVKDMRQQNNLFDLSLKGFTKAFGEL